MKNQNSGNASGWLKQFQDVERSEEELIHTISTTRNFCDAVDRTAQNTAFEREPSQFFALLHELAPESLKK